MSFLESVKGMFSGKCAECRSTDTAFRCTKCGKQYCEKCSHQFGGMVGVIVMQELSSVSGGTFNSAKVFGDKNRNFCPSCFAPALHSSVGTGRQLIRLVEQTEPSCLRK